MATEKQMFDILKKFSGRRRLFTMAIREAESMHLLMPGFTEIIYRIEELFLIELKRQKEILALTKNKKVKGKKK